MFSSLSFYIAQLSSENALEVDPVDLIGIETLRLFETDIYEALPRYRDFLTDTAGVSMNLFGTEKKGEVRKQKLDEILQLVQAKAREKAARLLKFLFPPIVENFRDQRESLIKRRVSRAENFYRYFTFRPAVSEVSELELQSFLASAVSPDELEELFQKSMDRGAFGELLTRIDHCVGSLSGEQATGLAIASVNFADRIPRRPESLIFDEVLRLQWIFENIAKSVVPNAKDTKVFLSSVVSELFQKSSGLIVPAQLCSAINRGLSKGQTSWDQLITAEELKELALLVVRKIEELAQGGKLKDHFHSAMLIFFWKHWGNLSDVKNWISSTIGNHAGLFWFLNAVSTNVDFADPQLPNNPFGFKIEVVEEFADPIALQKTIGALDATAISEKERMLVESFTVALRRWYERSHGESSGTQETV